MDEKGDGELERGRNREVRMLQVLEEREMSWEGCWKRWSSVTSPRTLMYVAAKSFKDGKVVEKRWTSVNGLRRVEGDVAV